MRHIVTGTSDGPAGEFAVRPRPTTAGTISAMPSSHRREGAIKSWNDERGFGFIAPLPHGRDVFVHIKAFPRGSGRPGVGERVAYELEVTPEGRHRALHAELHRPPTAPAARTLAGRPGHGRRAYLAIAAFGVVYVVITLNWPVPWWVLGVYVTTSAGCFVLYAADKSAAIGGRWRIAERSLLALGFAGGWPGAIIAQQTLRHKTTKASFRSVFWASVVSNIFVFVVLATPIFSETVAFGTRVLLDIQSP